MSVLLLAGWMVSPPVGAEPWVLAVPTFLTQRTAQISDLKSLQRAYQNRQSNIQVLQEGTVTRILPNDNQGSRHQKFLLKLASDQTVLIAHNIDLSPRLPSLQVGDRVRFYGEYEWNSKGGVIHWTHRDPQRRHVDGWLEYKGKRYQ
jgi:hypothetical protein